MPEAPSHLKMPRSSISTSSSHTTNSSTATLEAPSAVMERRRWWWKPVDLLQIDVLALTATAFGFGMTLWEKDTGLRAVPHNLDEVWHMEMEDFAPELVQVIKSVSVVAILVRGLTKQLYLIAYLMLFYAFWGGNRGFVLPWLVLGALRSILVEVINCFTGCVVCSLYGELKPSCLDFVFCKGLSLACSVFLWLLVLEFFSYEDGDEPRPGVGGRPRISVTLQSSARSLDSILAEAIIDWFIEEADRCRRFDSDVAVDEDIRRFEEELGYRAGRFLELKPEEILSAVRQKGERSRSAGRCQSSTQTEVFSEMDPGSELPGEISPISVGKFLSETSSEGRRSLSEIDSMKRNPLRKFPYISTDESDDCLKELVGDIAVGAKSVSVQTPDDDFVYSEQSVYSETYDNTA